MVTQLRVHSINTPRTTHTHSPAVHRPVMVTEVLDGLTVATGGRYVDCTVGGGGHAAAILSAGGPDTRLLGLDADPAALEAARTTLVPYGKAALLVQANFSHLEIACDTHKFRPVDGILFDLGMSSLQLAAGRGFSFQEDAPLDMRYDPSQGLTGADIVNRYPEVELARILYKYGEERYARRITRHILENRPLDTARELAEVVEMALGGQRNRLHPATRTFLALRLVVNQELENLADALGQAVKLLRPGGRLVVLSYHSLEDRVVKDFISQESRQCLCPPRTPVCLCHHIPTIRPVSRRVITPTPQEVKSNPRSRSAKLRVAERL
ncbi:MAG: 16S rRNA (cytosine(1402)-N(4))-methyltransferase RsmH [Dehalococcoidia bacterium]